jgi:hypothetical protein
MKIQTVFAMGMLLSLLACSKLTQENYNKITMGMTYDEVVAALGAPAKCDDVMGVRSCKWGDDTRSVNVNFLGGKVLLYSSSNLH